MTTEKNELGLHTSLDLAEACADFYILERMSSAGFHQADRTLKSLESKLAVEFTTYLDMAVGGELRHAAEFRKLIIPPSLVSYMDTAKTIDFDRYKCWQIWQALQVDRNRLQRLSDGAAIFDDPVWTDRSVGGKMWGTIARVLLDYLTHKIKPRTFIDRCWTLQHNHSVVFDKCYRVSELNTILEIQAQNRYDTLVRYASPEVRVLWREWNDSLVGEYDRVWYGR
jgi:hypothetical protein